MFCPNCKSEYIDGVTVCPDCNVELVDKLPDPPTHLSDEPLKHVATAPNEVIGQMWSDILKQNGIRSMLRDETSKPFPYVPGAIGPLEIYVLSSDADKAKLILAPFIG